MRTKDLPHTKESLIAAIATGLEPKFLFFWGHQPKHPHQVGKECLSQWYEIAFTVNNVTYPSTEHYMMAEKARLFNDSASLHKILAAKHPGEAKTLGRSVTPFDETQWQEHRFTIALQGNMAKFQQNTELKTFLLTTGNKILVEASPMDSIWGIGLAQDHPDAENPAAWPGLNLLGFVLMKVRAAIVLAEQE